MLLYLERDSIKKILSVNLFNTVSIFDSIFLKTPVICLPQDRDQHINAQKVNYFNANLVTNRNNIKKNFIYNFDLLYKKYNLRKILIKNGTKIINNKNMKKIFKKLLITCKV